MKAVTAACYNTETGKIDSIISCPESLLPIQDIPEGYTYLIVDGENQPRCDTHYVNNGKLEHLPVRPSPAHHFDFSKMKWVIDSNTSWSIIRYERDKAIAATDWITNYDVRLSDKKRKEWEGYRQALRDITKQQDPENIVWPTPPA